MGKVLPSQRLLKQFEEQLVFGEMNLSEIVRSGAQMMLQYALEREVTEALGRNYYENAPATTKEKGRRNGYESHRVLTGEGAVTVQVPQVRETEKVFQSKILDAYVSRTEKLDELIARMYVHGMSTRDIEATFADVLSGTGISKSVVSRVTRCLSEDFEAFRKRDLSNEKLLYLELDGQPVTEKIADITKETTHGMSCSSGPSRRRIEYLFELFQHQNDWQILGIEPDATPDAIKHAFQKKTFEYHPDRYAELAEPDVRRKLSFLFTRVSEAFATLSNRVGTADVPVSPKIAPSEHLVGSGEPAEEAGEGRKHANTIFDRAKKAFEERDHLKTVLLCREAIELASDRADYFHLLGLALSQNRKSRLEAEQNLKTASKLEPRNPEYLSALGTLYENEGLRWRARTMFENAHAAVGSYSMADDDLASFLFQDRSSLAAPSRISVSG